MPEEHLKSDEDVDKILRIAVKLPGGTGTADLRSRLQAAADEMGITPEQLEEAEKRYAEEKEHQDALETYVQEQRSGFLANLFPYLIAVALFFFLDFRKDGTLSWFWWPTLGWGVGVFFHALSVFNRKSQSFQKEFARWKRRRDRRRRRESDDDDDEFGINARLSGVHIAVGNKIITPKFEVSDLRKSDRKRKDDDDDDD
ncbi:MAG: 2TM domain-containing protein [Fimbriimonadaceae bacterium]|nr:2TM domain-containing protein [Fimbriimonadaceae bacterium]